MYHTDIATVKLDDSQLITLKLESGNLFTFSQIQKLSVK